MESQDVSSADIQPSNKFYKPKRLKADVSSNHKPLKVSW